MAAKRPIDVSTWPRREHFEHYRRRVPCTYSVTVELDVTAFVSALARARRKTYPSQIWAIASVVNRHEEFRLTVDADGAPSVWDVVNPSFTVFNSGRETFANVWADYDPQFSRFHDAVTGLLATHRAAEHLFPQGNAPQNTFNISSVPWLPFTGFDLHIEGGHNHYLPIFTLGQYVGRDDRTLMPLAIQAHHAAADGFHTARLVNELQRLFAEAPEWVS